MIAKINFRYVTFPLGARGEWVRDRARPSPDPSVGGVGEVGGSFPPTVVPSDWSADLNTEIYGMLSFWREFSIKNGDQKPRYP